MTSLDNTGITSPSGIIEVALASNCNYFIGLLVTILSLLRSNPRNAFRIHIIDGGLTKRQQTSLLECINGHSINNEVLFHVIDESTFRGFRTDYGHSYMAYARVLLASLIKGDQVIYLDSDLLIAADIRPLWELNLNGYVAAAAQDQGIKWLKNDYPFASEFPHDDERYFNSGVMVINLSSWRKLSLQDKLLRVIADAPQRFQWWDQTAMNAVFRGQVCYIDGKWNRVSDSLDTTAANSSIIFHYVGASKPWNKYLDSKDFRLWRFFYGRYVRARGWLCLNRSFLVSFLQHARYRAMLRIPFLRLLAFGALYAKIVLLRRGELQQLDVFTRRYSAAGINDRNNRTSLTEEMDEFAARHWDR